MDGPGVSKKTRRPRNGREPGSRRRELGRGTNSLLVLAKEHHVGCWMLDAGWLAGWRVEGAAPLLTFVTSSPVAEFWGVLWGIFWRHGDMGGFEGCPVCGPNCQAWLCHFVTLSGALSLSLCLFSSPSTRPFPRPRPPNPLGQAVWFVCFTLQPWGVRSEPWL